MSFFSEASLAMIPSGYKTSKVYSALPITGDGDLTFSRSNDTATRVGPNGYIEKVRTNIALYSEDQTAWTNQNETSVTANAAANPLDGAVTADKVIPSAVTDDHYRGLSMGSMIGEISSSIYVKADGYSIIDYGIFNSTAANYPVRVVFDLSTQAITYINGTIASITSVGSGWYRISVTGSVASTSTMEIFHRVRPSGTGGTYAGDGTSGMLLWGCQLESGVTTDYIGPTTSAAVSVGPVANVPRLDYLDSSSPRLLLEPQRTNLATYSEQADTYTKIGATIGSNVLTSPDGYTNADSLIEDGSTGLHTFYNFGLTTFTAAAYTASVFAKKGGRDWFSVQLYDGTQGFVAFFNLDTGVVGNVDAGATATITNYGNGWYRCTITATTAAGSSGGIAIFSASANGSTNYAGTNGLAAGYFYGWQLELAAYATSYIPTLGASVTRGADLGQKSSISGLFGATATTFVFDFIKKENAIGWTITGDDGTKLFSLCQFDNTSGIPRVVFDDGVDTTSTLAALSNGRHKIAISYATNDTRIYIDGTLVLTDTVCTYYQMNKIAVNGTSWTGFTNNTNAFEINQFLMIPAATSNDDLATLTTI